jgi:flotillin
MSPYAFSLALGAMGLAAMAAIGLGSHAHHGGGPGHGHGGHGHGSHGQGHGSHGHGHAHHEPAALRVAAVLSPRLWFTLLAGFGATGMLVRPLVAGGPLRAVLAVAGALLFEALEVPLFTTGTTISSKVINVDLDITDQTADVDETGTPRPIKVRVLASAIVSVGDSDEMIKTAANRFFAKPEADQVNTLTDLLSSSGRRAINLLTHDQLFSAKTAPVKALPVGASGTGTAIAIPSSATAVAEAEDDDDPLAVIIRKACSRELTDLGLIFNSLNIKVVQSEVAEARRRQSAAEAQANADIVSAQQTRGANAALIAQAVAKKQDALAVQKVAELDATQISQARADAERVKIEAEAAADAEAIRIRRVAEATAESIRRVNESIREGGESYFRYKQIELLPQVAPAVAQAVAEAKLVTIASDGRGAPDAAANNIMGVIQTVLAAQLVGRTGSLESQTAPSAAVPASVPPAAKDGVKRS